MFTGLIEDVGQIERVVPRGRDARIKVRTAIDLGDVAIGDSIAVDGACLTVVAMGAGSFEAELSEETLKRTALGGSESGRQVNLERALRMGDRLGGHMVQGHVDAVGRVVGLVRVGDGWEVSWELPESLLDTVVEKGSIAIDGVSLTIAHLEGARVTVAVIAHTASQTTVTSKAVGAPVNVETDLVGKYVRRTLDRMGVTGGRGGLDLEALKKAGFA